MTVVRFEDFTVWQKSQTVAELVYRSFRDIRDMGFRDQIQRAVVSIGNNIAEGYERKSNAEFKQYLSIAKGSCGEVRSMAHLASRVGHMSPTASDQLVASCEEIARMLSALIKKL